MSGCVLLLVPLCPATLVALSIGEVDRSANQKKAKCARAPSWNPDWLIFHSLSKDGDFLRIYKFMCQ
jgi:hypothetical protein